MLKRKAQAISIEMLFSLIIFLLLFSTTIILFQGEIRKNIKEEEKTLLKMKTIRILTELIESSGTPSNWENQSNYELPGLAITPLNLSNEKLDKFKQEPMSTLTDKLLLNEGFYFYVERDGDKLYEKGLDFNSENSIIMQRIITLNDEPAKAVFKLYGFGIGIIESSGSFSGSDCSLEKNFFGFSWENAEFVRGQGNVLTGWKIENKSIDCNSIIIDKMKVEWLNDTDNTALKKIKLNGTTVWNSSSSQTYNNILVDITDFSIPELTSYSIDNKLEFNKSTIHNESEKIRITFQFDDGSAYTTGWYQS